MLVALPRHLEYCSTSPAVTQFVNSLNTLPDLLYTRADIDRALLPALQYECLLRHELDASPYSGLLDIFDIPRRCRMSRTRHIDNKSQEYIFPITANNLQPLDAGESSCVDTLETFKNHFDLFTHGVLACFNNWENVVVAGGAVLAALLNHGRRTPRELVQLYHTLPYEPSDVDIFLWGLSEADAKLKMLSIFAAVKASVLWGVVAVRKANVISIHTQYPHRPIQIILRLYQSPTEILIGFDIDCCSICFDGQRVWATPRALASIITRQITIDLTRRSPSYEIRLTKYARRGFEILYPSLDRQNINPALYDREMPQLPLGLARLLVFEHYVTHPKFYKYIQLPGNPIKTLQAGLFPSIQRIGKENGHCSSFYDHSPFHIPYALNWDSNSIKDLAQRTEKWLTKERFLKEYFLHRHAMRAYDNIEDCFGNVCKNCPEPRNECERQEQNINDQKYVRGSLRFIVQNPGQQNISGSFNPINDNEWENDVYSTR